jgi:hypothetical protein
MKPNLETLQIAPASMAEPAEIIRLGKDEMNLAEFPIALLADRVPKGQTSIEFQDRIFDEKSGKTIVRKVTIKAPEEANGRHGLPTAVDDDVILGLIQLTKMANGFTSREVEFSRLELIRLLGWPDSGESYRRLSVSLKRWLSVTLLYENAWRDNRKGAWITKGFHILDNIELNDTRTTGEQGELFPSKITWNKVVFESFEAGYLKSLDYGLYLKLKHQTSRRMYRFLSKRMYRGPDVDLDLRDFAITHIGLSPSYGNNAGKLKEKLQPAIDELAAVGFLEAASKEKRYRKEGKNWTIHLVQQTPALTVERASMPTAITQPPLVAELTGRGVTAKTATELVSKHPAETIQLKIDVFDWLVGRQDKRVGKSPEGYLVKSIRDDYKAPKGYVSKADRERQAEAAKQRQQADAEERRRQQQEAAHERALNEEVAAYRQSLTPEQLAQLETDALAQASEEERHAYDDPVMTRFRKSLQHKITDEHIRRIVQARKNPAADA